MKNKTVKKFKHMFLDDRCIKEMNGTRLVINQPEKHPANPILAAGKTWEEGKAVGQINSLIYDTDEKLFKVWYNLTWSRNFGPGPEWKAMAYATSTDGIHWEKPSLGLVEFNGSKDNNILFNNNIYGTVFKDPSETRCERKYKMAFAASGEGLSLSGTYQPINAAYSPDGIHWTIPGHKEKHWPYQFHSELPFTTNPIMPEGTDAITDYSWYWDADLRRYVALLRPTWNVPRCVCMSESDDFVHWTPRRVILQPDEKDPHHVSNFHGMTVMRYDEYYIGFLEVYHTEDDYEYYMAYHTITPDMPPWQETMDVQLAMSYDGRNWKRVADRGTFIPCGKDGEFDRGLVLPRSHPFVLNDEIWIYYQACPDRHNFAEHKSKGRYRSTGLARLRKDGFVSIDAEKEGTVLTRNLKMTPYDILLNASAKNGRILAEAVTPMGDVIEGFSRDDCVPFTGDSLEHMVQWKHGRQPVSIIDTLWGGFCLKFYMEQAKLYSFTLTWEQ